MARTVPGDDLYELLGVERTDDGATIRRAYQRLARRFHPDLHPEDEDNRAVFDALTRAYEVLSDPERRRQYDRGRLPAGQRRVVTRRSRGLASGELAWLLDELIVEIAPEAAPPSRPAEAGDVAVELGIGFAEALRGVTTSVPIQRESPCPDCAGAGCAACDGRGTRIELDRLRVRLPAGVDDGTRLRLRGRGNPAGPPGARHGDVFVTVRVRPHACFQRRGADIHVDVPVRVGEAIYGAEIRVPTIDGPVTVKIPPGTAAGQRFRLRDLGAPRPDGSRGDHYYTVCVEVPRSDDPELRRRLAEAEEDDPRAGLPAEPL